jgi:hypothetical protein
MDQAEATIGRYVNRVNIFSTHSSICILTSFIHAHQSAEDAILLHLGEQEGEWDRSMCAVQNHLSLNQSLAMESAKSLSGKNKCRIHHYCHLCSSTRADKRHYIRQIE